MTNPKTAVITGSSSGIGHGIAEGLATAGYNIVLNGIEPAEQIEPARKALNWEATLSLNLSACLYATKALVAGVKDRKWGRIINIASAHGLVASSFKSAYVAAKHGIVGLTTTIVLEVAEYGVTVNAICPDYVWTPLVEKQIPDTAKARGMDEEQVIRDVLLAAQPTKKFATSEFCSCFT